jgi:murein DD-endopeptidase MepM/ murein hydrolase activator NlpD
MLLLSCEGATNVVITVPIWREMLLAGLLVVLTIVGLTGPSAARGQSSPAFSDDFDGSGLDSSRWRVLEGSSGISVGGGLLRLDGLPAKKHVDSMAQFGSGTVVRAHIALGGDYQKFGFHVNPPDVPGSAGGYYFDTFEASEGGGPNQVHALVWSGSQLVAKQRIPVSWGEFHDFEIQRTQSEVLFLIDGAEVARTAATFTGEAPLGIWNDRASTMHVDRVRAGRLFQMPFPCGDRWSVSTYAGHGASDNATDWNTGQHPNDDLYRPVEAGVSGVVTQVLRVGQGTSPRLGNRIVIDAGGGWTTHYAHLFSFRRDQLPDVAEGQRVDPRTRIGRVGRTGLTRRAGPHLHYEQRYNGVAQPIVIDGEAVPVPYGLPGLALTSRNCQP